MKLISLDRLLKVTFKDKTQWDYYNYNHYNPLNNPEDSLDFIRDFYIIGEKTGLYIGDEKDLEGDFENHLYHTIIVFFLGIAIKRVFFETLDIIDNDDRFDFNYIWYLTALYHDYGYRIEGKTMYNFSKCDEPRNINIYVNRYFYCARKKFGIKKICPNFSSGRGVCEQLSFSNNKRNKTRKSKKSNSCNMQCKGSIKFSNGITVMKEQYSSIVKHRYFLYKINEHHKYDHGIVGGDILFSRLYGNYIMNFNQIEGYQRGSDFTNFCYHNIQFSCKQFKIFSYIGDCIAAHNIWKCPDNKEDIYKHYQLNQLIGKNFKKVSFFDNPLLFILCLCDSLEPSKWFDRENDYLKKILIAFNKIEHSIEIDFSKIELKDLCEQYRNNILSLTEWMLCEVIILNKDRVKICLGENAYE